jgi:phosphohistidine phosphatase
MRHLYLIRHAKSSWDNPLLRDFERTLNSRGVETAPKMAELLWKEGIKPDLIVTSPARRAMDTARFFGVQFGLMDDHFIPEKNIYEASPTTILRIISQLPETAKTVFMFGHNPTFTEVANLFTSDDFIENIPTCGVVCLKSTAQQWNELHEGNTIIEQKWFPKFAL